MNAQTKVENANLAIWNVLGKTDPAHTKGFSRAGGFKGTAIKPIWITHRLTEHFGPCGIGWGIGQPQFQVVPGGDETMVYCTVECWYAGTNGEPASIWGVGGDKVVTKRSNGLFHDDEAFKKAFTDAIGNAFKFIGVSADVHMGLFDDSKYVEAVNNEFRQAEQAEPHGKVEGITKIKARLRELKSHGDDETDLEAFNSLLHGYREELTKIKEANHDWWTGDDADFEGFKNWIRRRREELSSPDAGMVSGLIESLNRCETKIQLQNWLTGNGDVVESLDGADSRKFQLAYDLKASLIDEMDAVN